MENNLTRWFNSVAAIIGGAVGSLIGEIDGILTALIIFMAIDYITGIMVAVSTKTLNSSVGFSGLAKKVFILFLVIVANVLDVHIMGGSGFVRGIVIAFYLANEGISILENAGKLGVPYPYKIKEILEQLKEEKQNANKL